MRVGRIAVGAAIVLIAGAAYTLRQTSRVDRLVVGRFISPQGEQTEVGSFPVNMALSPDGRFLVVTNVGFRQQLTVIDAANGQVTDRVPFLASSKGDTSLYYGLAFRGNTLYASQGSQDRIGVFDLGDDGKLKRIRTDVYQPEPNPAKLPGHIAGIAVGTDQTAIVFNQSHSWNDFRGRVLIRGAQDRTVDVPAFPLAAVMTKDGRTYVSCERDGLVAAIEPSATGASTFRVGEGPAYLLLSPDDRTLYVTNSSSDTLSIVDTKTNQVTDTILLRGGDLRGLPSSTPLGMALAPDGKKLFVALADLNAVAVVDLASNRLEGMVDVGWYPTSVAVTPDGKRLFVANAKGVQPLNPNDKPVRNVGQYPPNIIEGTVSMLDVATTLKSLPVSTQRVLSNNLAQGDVAKAAERSFTRPKVDHVIYVIKENRTYDQVFGDLKQGNGDPSICLFPREVTPNQHALAERFALLDNFYVCAEVSADGWNWSTSGMANAYTQRNVPYNYSGRGRNYDFEGTNNGVPVEVEGKPDVATAPGGYLWDAALKQRLSLRNYGMFQAWGSDTKRPDGKPIAVDDQPTKKALESRTCMDFRKFDMAYADSDAWVKHGLPSAPKQLAYFGSHRDPSRMTAFRREFDDYVRTGKLPKLLLLRLGRNHTSGTSAGQSSPRAMVADNDYAVGELVEMVSHSPYWKSTVICVLEDDAQAGFDHVDCHRSPALVVSPWVEKGRIDSRFYNTDSMLHTMALLLGVKPWNGYVATAPPIGVFGRRAENGAPYDAILPAKEIVGQVNSRTAYRAKDSERLIARFEEESMPDIELNDILWGSIKGKAPRPVVRGVRWGSAVEAEDRD